jgi:hypothetical protein
MSIVSTFERSPRLNPDSALAAIADVAGVRLMFDGWAPGGEVGAAYVRWPDGRRSVLSMGQPRVAPLLALARTAGVPAPEYELTVDDGDVSYLVQSRLPGAPPTSIDRPLIESLLDINDRLAGLLGNDPQRSGLSLFLLSDGPGFCLHEPLRAYGRRSARLLDWIHEVGAESDTATGDDLVHLDFHTGNVLVSNGAISGVVDWDGAQRGDGALDLVTLAFDLSRRAPDLRPWLTDVLAERVPTARLRPFWAHMSLRQIDWSIRHHTPADVEFWLTVAEAGAY